jgi:hypothetical protein
VLNPYDKRTHRITDAEPDQQQLANERQTIYTEIKNKCANYPQEISELRVRQIGLNYADLRTTFCLKELGLDQDSIKFKSVP